MIVTHVQKILKLQGLRGRKMKGHRPQLLQGDLYGVPSSDLKPINGCLLQELGKEASSYIIAMASNLKAMASTLIAMASMLSDLFQASVGCS